MICTCSQPALVFTVLEWHFTSSDLRRLFFYTIPCVLVPRRYWTLAEAKPQHWEVLDSPLPSDIRFRQDLAALAACDLDKAQHYKELLEKQQRADRKLRETAGIYEH